MATLMKGLGRFISIDACGEIMAPLFLEGRDASAEKSGRLVTFKDGELRDCEKNPMVLDPTQRERLWKECLLLCADEAIAQA